MLPLMEIKECFGQNNMVVYILVTFFFDMPIDQRERERKRERGPMCKMGVFT